MNTQSKFCTNWFTVTNEQEYEKIKKHIKGPYVMTYSETKDGVRRHCITGDDMYWCTLPSEYIKENHPDANTEKLFVTTDENDEEMTPIKFEEIDDITYGQSIHDENGNCLYNANDIDEDYNIDIIIERIQKILPDNECLVYTSITDDHGHVYGDAIVATNTKTEQIDLYNWAAKTAENLGCDIIW